MFFELFFLKKEHDNVLSARKKCKDEYESERGDKIGIEKGLYGHTVERYKLERTYYQSTIHINYIISYDKINK